MKKLVLRITVPLVCCIFLTSSPSADAQEPAPSGPQAAAIFAILIGVPVGIGFGVYYAMHSPHKIEGCVADQGGTLVLTGANDTQYSLSGKIAAITPGQRLLLSGKSHKNHKRRIFTVKKVAQNYGPCSAAPATP